MRKFLLKLLYLILPLVALSYPLDYLISNALKEDHGMHGEYEVWNAIYENKIDSDIVIYGSSRAWVQINPEILETYLGKKTYNFGVDGHNFRIQYLRHLEYIKHNKKPRHIIVSVDAFTLQKRDNISLLLFFQTRVSGTGLTNRTIDETQKTHHSSSSSFTRPESKRPSP